MNKLLSIVLLLAFKQIRYENLSHESIKKSELSFLIQAPCNTDSFKTDALLINYFFSYNTCIHLNSSASIFVL